MSRVIYPRRNRPAGGTLTLLHLSDDNLRLLFDLIDIPLALKLTCRALRSLAPKETETKVAHVVKGVRLIVWAHQCGLFEHFTASAVAKIAATVWPGGDETIEYIDSPGLFQHDLYSLACKGDLCAAAAGAGLIPMLEALDYEQHYEKTKNKDPLCMAAKAGHFECVKWMFALDKERTILNSSGDVLDAAAETGQLEIVRWLVDRITYRGGSACVNAARGGHVAVLDFLIKDGFPWSRDLYLQAMHVPGTGVPPLATIQYVITNGLQWAREATWDEAVTHGQTETVEWLADNDPDGVLFHGDSGDALLFAAARGCTAMLRLALKHGYALEPELVDRAAQWNRMETLKWLHTKGVIGTEGSLINAAERGNIEILETLHAHGGYVFRSTLYEHAATFNQDASLEWLESIDIPLPPGEEERQHMLDRSLEHANLQMAEWVLARGCGELKRQHMFEAADNYQIELFNWLVNRDCPYDLDALRRVCESDHLGRHDPIGAMVVKLCERDVKPTPFATSDPNKQCS
jgi:hypothetical protein